MSVVVTFFSSFAVAFVVTPCLRSLSYRLNLLDVPNERSSHHRPTPRTGGYAIVIAMLGTVLASPARNDSGIAVIAAGALAVAIAAAVDEFRPVPHVLRFVVQILVAAAATWAAGTIARFVDLPFAGRWSFFSLAMVVSVVWVVGVLNGFNFMDGLNGIAALEAIVCAAAMSILFLGKGDASGALACAALAGAAAGFLPWNFPSGSIFMGDVGSAALGFSLAMLVLRLSRDDVSLVAAALPLFPFLFDTGTTIVRRAAHREKFFSTPHRTHLYQRLNQQGWSHAAVTMLWSGLAIFCSCVAVLYDGLQDGGKALALLIVVSLHVAVGIWVSVRDRRLRT